MKQWRPLNSHTRNTAHKGLGRLSRGGTEERSDLRPPSRASRTHGLTPTCSHRLRPTRPRLASLPPSFHTHSPNLRQANPPGSTSAYLSLPSPQLRLPTAKAGSHNTDPRFYSRTPPRQNPRKLKGETAREGKQREEAKGDGDGKQKDGPEAIWSVLPASLTVARSDQIL